MKQTGVAVAFFALLIALTAVFGLQETTAARAPLLSTVTQSVTISVSNTTAETLSVPQFDPGLGELLEIEFLAENGQCWMNSDVENLSVPGCGMWFFDRTCTIEFDVQPYDSGGFSADDSYTMNIVPSFVQLGAAEENDCAGSDYGCSFQSYNHNDGVIASFTNEISLSAYTGTGTATFKIQRSAYYGGYVTQTCEGFATCGAYCGDPGWKSGIVDLKVRYTYQP